MSLPHYLGEAGRHYHGVKRGLPVRALPWVIRLRAAKFADHVQPTDTVLEYGVGAGWNLAGLNCARKIGIDVSEAIEEQARNLGIEFFSSSAPLPAALADVVICHHMLEHAIAPAQVLFEIKRLLKPSGVLLLNVPCERPCLCAQFVKDEPNHHLYSWNVQSLGNLVLECGFEFEHMRLQRFRFDRAAAVWAHRIGLGERTYRTIRRVGLWILPEYEIAVRAQPKPEC